MNRSVRASTLALLTGVLLLGSAVTIAMSASPAGAHGSTQEPASRVYTCRFENPKNSMCATAWASNSQALYDWMEVNIGDAAGRHRELIPDGQLCSAGRAKYAAFDEPGAWPVTALRSNEANLVNLVYENTAPHSTEYYRVYITRTGFDARTDRLTWADLELAHDSGPLARASQQSLQAALPNRDVPAILYIVWQRSDSPEAFYACSDVTVAGGSGPGAAPTAPTSTAPAPADPTPTTSTPTTAAPTTQQSTAPTTADATSASTPRSSPTSIAGSPTPSESTPAIPTTAAPTAGVLVPANAEAPASDPASPATSNESDSTAVLAIGSDRGGAVKGFDEVAAAGMRGLAPDAETSSRGRVKPLFSLLGLGSAVLALAAVGLRRANLFLPFPRRRL